MFLPDFWFEEKARKLRQDFDEFINKAIHRKPAEIPYSRKPTTLQEEIAQAQKENKPRFMLVNEENMRRKEAYHKEVVAHENDPGIDDRIPELREKYDLPPKKQKKRNIDLDISF